MITQLFLTYEDARLFILENLFDVEFRGYTECTIEDLCSDEFNRKIYKERYHSSYLRSERWEDVRKAALARDGYRCKDCGSPFKLQGHHTSYRHVNIYPKNYQDLHANFDKEVADVITLCERCHKKRHGIVSAEPKYINYVVLGDGGNVIESVKILNDGNTFI